jgi:broad specificity phosphatase PhoE
MLLAVLLLTLVPVTAAAQATAIVVRHAERLDSSTDSPLSAAGHARATRLAAMLKDAGISAIYTTERQRTTQTAQPLADALRLTPRILKVDDIDGVVAAVRTARDGDRILVVGHSNTVPTILQRLGVSEPVTIGDDDYANLFVVTPRGVQATVVRLLF